MIQYVHQYFFFTFKIMSYMYIHVCMYVHYMSRMIARFMFVILH